MSRFGEILGKGVLILTVVGINMQREQAIAAFATAVESGDDAEADKQVAEAVRAEHTLRDLGITPPQ
jgi:hypothetical protein